MPGYNLQQDLRRDREDTAQGRGGGLLVYTKEGIVVLSVDTGTQPHQSCKFLVSDVYVTLVYRPPSSPPDSVTRFADTVRAAERNSVLIGDFNIPDIDWGKGTAKGRSREFLDAVEDSLMTQMVEFVTHTKGNTLDLVLTNIPERITDVQDVGRLGRSDHVMIMTKVSVKKEQKTEREGLPAWSHGDQV